MADRVTIPCPSGCGRNVILPVTQDKLLADKFFDPIVKCECGLEFNLDGTGMQKEFKEIIGKFSDSISKSNRKLNSR